MNICIFDGYVGKDADTAYLPSGVSVTGWPLAVKSGYGDNEITTWIRCKAFKKEKLGQYLTKGTKITVHGELANREFEDRDGNKRMSLELNVRDVVLPPRDKGQSEDAPF
jgi:single-strand DNA-binding protein